MNDEIFVDKDEKLKVDVPKEKRHLNTTAYDYSVSFLYGLMSGESPKIILAVPFQRKFVWKVDRSSQLIESLIMNVPIPPLYFSEEENGKWLVIDGLQRLSSILGFYQNEYALKDLEILKELDGKYKDLTPKARSLLDDSLMRAIVIKKDSHPDIKFDIFMRLNKGAVTLNYQELRNCLYRGPLNDAIKELAKEPAFLLLLGLKKPHQRYLDVEFILRFFSLSANMSVDENGDYFIKEYNGALVLYMNDFMKNNANITQEGIAKLATSFKETISKVFEILGPHAFRNPFVNSKGINRSIADYILMAFERVSIEDLRKNKDAIVALSKSVGEDDEDFKKSISTSTNQPKSVNLRVSKYFKSLEALLRANA